MVSRYLTTETSLRPKPKKHRREIQAHYYQILCSIEEAGELV